MFVYLSKLLPLFVFPLGLVTLLLILGLSTERRREWHRAFLILALVHPAPWQQPLGFLWPGALARMAEFAL